MTWIRTIPLSEADEKLRKAMENQMILYPKEYAIPVHPMEGGGAQIVASHSLIPEGRQHEMIATMVSVTNRCVY